MHWIDPEKISESWLPEIYSESYQPLFHWMHSRVERSFIELGNYFSVVSRSQHSNLTQLPIWHVKLERNSITLTQKAIGAVDGPITILPEEAIIVGRMSTDDFPISYWNSSIAGGSAYIDNNLIAIEPSKRDTYAWVVKALRSELVQLQIKRSSSTLASIKRLNLTSLLKTEIPVVSEELLLTQNVMVRDELLFSANLSKAIAIQNEAKNEVKQLLLTGATFEERMTQFEEYLNQQTFINPRKAFFAELISDRHNGNRYMVRPLRSRYQDSNNVQAQLLNDLFNVLSVQVDLDSNNQWTSWIEDSESERFRVFYVDGDKNALHSSISTSLLRYYANTTYNKRENNRPIIRQFPSYSSYFDIVCTDYTGNRLVDVDELNDISLDWYQDDNARKLLYELYSPVLTIKLYRDNLFVGIYLLFIDFDNSKTPFLKSTLEGYGVELSKFVAQLSDFFSDAARRESLRRLSSVMHRLNGPTGRAANAIQDIISFLEINQEIGSRLIPDDATANSRASMLEEPLERHNLRSRLSDISCAIEDIKKVSYQVRRLRLVQGDLDKLPCDAFSVIEQSLTSIDKIIPNLKTEIIQDSQHIININSDVITAAFEEVLSNACREMKEHSIKQPEIHIYIQKADNYIQFRIVDNGLPVHVSLISNPFDEDASKYARSGRGSGLGLTIVRETFLRHGGNCDLYENKNTDGSRIPGVTFEATLPEFIC